MKAEHPAVTADDQAGVVLDRAFGVGVVHQPEAFLVGEGDDGIDILMAMAGRTCGVPVDLAELAGAVEEEVLRVRVEALSEDDLVEPLVSDALARVVDDLPRALALAEGLLEDREDGQAIPGRRLHGCHAQVHRQGILEEPQSGGLGQGFAQHPGEVRVAVVPRRRCDGLEDGRLDQIAVVAEACRQAEIAHRALRDELGVAAGDAALEGGQVARREGVGHAVDRAVAEVAAGVLEDLVTRRLACEGRLDHLHPALTLREVPAGGERAPCRQCIERGVGAVVLIDDLNEALRHEGVGDALFEALPGIGEEGAREVQAVLVGPAGQRLDQVPPAPMGRRGGLHLAARRHHRQEGAVAVEDRLHQRRQGRVAGEEPGLRQARQGAGDGGQVAAGRVDDLPLVVHQAAVAEELLEVVQAAVLGLALRLHRADGVGEEAVMHDAQVDGDHGLRQDQVRAGGREPPGGEGLDGTPDAGGVGAGQGQDIHPAGERVVDRPDGIAAGARVDRVGDEDAGAPEDGQEAVVVDVAQRHEGAAPDGLQVDGPGFRHEALGRHRRQLDAGAFAAEPLQAVAGGAERRGRHEERARLAADPEGRRRVECLEALQGRGVCRRHEERRQDQPENSQAHGEASPVHDSDSNAGCGQPAPGQGCVGVRFWHPFSRIPGARHVGPRRRPWTSRAPPAPGKERHSARGAHLRPAGLAP